MRSSNTVVLFLKVPRTGRVKTRLARDLGPGRARRVYGALVRRVLAVVAGRRPWRLVLAVTPERLAWRAWPRRLQRAGQGPGDLGVRMGRALRRYARPRAVVIGSDLPDLSVEAVRTALRRLGDADFVFGPSGDGGYWLVGWHRRRAWPRGALRACRWSSPHALADSRASLSANRVVRCADRLDDLDTLADWLAWRRSEEASRRVRGFGQGAPSDCAGPEGGRP